MSVAQTVKEPKRKPLDFLSFIYQNIALLAMIFVGYLFIRLVIAFLAVYSYGQARRSSYPKPRKKFPFEIFYLTSGQVMKRLPNLAILILTFAWFKFILVSCLTSSIKTNKVLVDTSFLIDSLQKIESTTRKPVFLGEYI